MESANMLGALQGPTRVQALCWSRPHPGRRQSQYSWAHMDPSAHSLAFRGGAEVPEAILEAKLPLLGHRIVKESTAPNSPLPYTP